MIHLKDNIFNRWQDLREKTSIQLILTLFRSFRTLYSSVASCYERMTQISNRGCFSYSRYLQNTTEQNSAWNDTFNLKMNKNKALGIETKRVHYWNSYQELWTALLKVIKFAVHLSQTLVDLVQLSLKFPVLLMVFVKQMLVFLSFFIIYNGRELAVK